MGLFFLLSLFIGIWLLAHLPIKQSIYITQPRKLWAEFTRLQQLVAILGIVGVLAYAAVIGIFRLGMKIQDSDFNNKR